MLPGPGPELNLLLDWLCFGLTHSATKFPSSSAQKHSWKREMPHTFISSNAAVKLPIARLNDVLESPKQSYIVRILPETFETSQSWAELTRPQSIYRYYVNNHVTRAQALLALIELNDN